MLLDAGAEINLTAKSGNTALIWATRRGHTDIVKLLLKHGADVTLRDVDGSTARDIALREGEKELVELLTVSGTKNGATSKN